MKLLDADHTEHTITVALDNDIEQIFTGVHEDFIAEAQKELYGKAYNPQESHLSVVAPKVNKPIPVPVDFI